MLIGAYIWFAESVCDRVYTLKGRVKQRVTTNKSIRLKYIRENN
jgi:hypothetical protein